MNNSNIEMEALALECEIMDLENIAMEGIFRSKENVEKAAGMKIAELLAFFIEKKGENYFLNDKSELKQLLAAQNVGNYKIITVNGIYFGIVDDGAYFVTKGRKGSKLTNADLKKLQSTASRSMTKADRKESFNNFKSSVGKKMPFGKKEESMESLFDFEDHDMDYGLESFDDIFDFDDDYDLF